MRLPENLVQYIRDEAKKISHGRIIIRLSESSNVIEVTTEQSERFKGGKP